MRKRCASFSGDCKICFGRLRRMIHRDGRICFHQGWIYGITHLWSGDLTIKVLSKRRGTTGGMNPRDVFLHGLASDMDREDLHLRRNNKWSAALNRFELFLVISQPRIFRRFRRGNSAPYVPYVFAWILSLVSATRIPRHLSPPYLVLPGLNLCRVKHTLHPSYAKVHLSKRKARASL